MTRLKTHSPLTVAQLQQQYRSGKNVMALLKKQHLQSENTREMIQVSYDLQAGSYVKYIKQHPEYIQRWSGAIAQVLNGLAKKRPLASLMEVGVGEATTLGNVSSKLAFPPNVVLGSDISWSRLKVAQIYLNELRVKKPVELFMADFFNLPLADNSVDIVYTAHSIEPNGGKELEILPELYRVARKYLVLLEPAYQFATKEGKQRMKEHAYITRLPQAAAKLGYDVIEYRPFEVTANPLNPTGLMIIRKKSRAVQSIKNVNFYCPISQQQLTVTQGFYFSRTGMYAYPILDGIPCLIAQNAILATQLAA